MRVLLLLALVFVGYSRQEGRSSSTTSIWSMREFDAFLATHRHRTNLLTGAEAADLLARLTAMNRHPDPLHHKSYASGYVWLCSGRERLGALAYFPREQILSCRGYEFRFQDTNDISNLFGDRLTREWCIAVDTAHICAF